MTTTRERSTRVVATIRTDVQRVALDCAVLPMHTAVMKQQKLPLTPVSTTVSTTRKRRAKQFFHVPPAIPADAPALPIYLSLAEAAIAARISIWTIRSWIRKGSLPAVKPGRRVMVDRNVLLAVLANPRPRTAREVALVTHPRVRKVG